MKQWNRWRPNVVVERNIEDVIETTWRNPMRNAAIKSSSSWCAAGFLVIHGKPRAVTLRGGGKVYPMIFDENFTKKWCPTEHLRAVDTYKREGEVFVHPIVLGYDGDEGKLRDEYGAVRQYYDQAKRGRDIMVRVFQNNTDSLGNLYGKNEYATELLMKMLEVDTIMQPIMCHLLNRLKRLKGEAGNVDLHGIEPLIRRLQQHVTEVAQRKEKMCELRRQRAKGMAT